MMRDSAKKEKTSSQKSVAWTTGTVRLIEESLPAPYIMCSPYTRNPDLISKVIILTCYELSLSVPLSFAQSRALFLLSLSSVSAAARRWEILGMSIRFLMHQKQQTKTCLKAGKMELASKPFQT